MKQRSDAQMQEVVLEQAKANGVACTPEEALEIGQLMRERITFPKDIWAEASYFFVAPSEYDEKVYKKKWNAEAEQVLLAYSEALREAGDFNAQIAHDILEAVLAKMGVGMGKVMQVLRMSITGVGGGPDLMRIIGLLGKEEVAKRIQAAVAQMKVLQA
jgi:glutamyl-tRNA synthetase